MRYHTVRIHLAKNLDTRASAAVTGAGSKNRLHSYLFLAKDIGAFCTTIQFQLKGCDSGFCIAIGDHGHDLLDIWAVWGVVNNHATPMKPPNLKIEFRDTPFHTMTSNSQEELLDAFSKVACASMKVGVGGTLRVEGTAYVQQLKATMGPVFYSRCVDAWAHLETMCKAKNLADDVVESGELHLAAYMYAKIISMIRLSLQNSMQNSTGSRVANESLHYLLHDVLCTLGYLQIKLHDLDGLDETVENLKSYAEAKLTTSQTQVAYLEGSKAYVRYLVVASNVFIMGPVDQGPDHTMSVSRMIDLISECQDHPYAMHDLAILKDVRNPQEPAFWHLPVKQCGAYKMAVPRLSFHLNPNVPTKPDYIVRNLNLLTMQHLSDDTKREIYMTQTMYRQSVTRWE
jgi:hypothetical protein